MALSMGTISPVRVVTATTRACRKYFLVSTSNQFRKARQYRNSFFILYGTNRSLAANRSAGPLFSCRFSRGAVGSVGTFASYRRSRTRSFSRLPPLLPLFHRTGKNRVPSPSEGLTASISSPRSRVRGELPRPWFPDLQSVSRLLGRADARRHSP